MSRPSVPPDGGMLFDWGRPCSSRGCGCATRSRRSTWCSSSPTARSTRSPRTRCRRASPRSTATARCAPPGTRGRHHGEARYPRRRQGAAADLWQRRRSGQSRRAVRAGAACWRWRRAPAWAMTVQLVPVPGETGPGAVLQGRIVAGRRRPACAGAAGTGKFAALVLNSPGGSVLEARDMARLIRALRVSVVVPDRAVCASACFLLFAAGRDKVAEPGAMIGVHSASVAGGNETHGHARRHHADGARGRAVRRARRDHRPHGDDRAGPDGVAHARRTRSDGRARRRRRAPRPAARVLPGSGAAEKSDWTRGFERGQAVGEGGDCAPPPGIGNQADFSPGLRVRASARARPGLRLGAGCGGNRTGRAASSTGARRAPPAASCDAPDRAVASARDWSLGCASGRRQRRR